jgi:hypothetical protein
VSWDAPRKKRPADRLRGGAPVPSGQAFGGDRPPSHLDFNRRKGVDPRRRRPFPPRRQGYDSREPGETGNEPRPDVVGYFPFSVVRKRVVTLRAACSRRPYKLVGSGASDVSWPLANARSVSARADGKMARPEDRTQGALSGSHQNRDRIAGRATWRETKERGAGRLVSSCCQQRLRSTKLPNNTRKIVVP